VKPLSIGVALAAAFALVAGITKTEGDVLGLAADPTLLSIGAVGLRQVISEQEIREIFDILRERTIAFDNQTWNRRYRGFMDKIKTGSIYDVAEVLRDLYRLKTDKQLSFGERRMLDTARSLIVKEIAIARNQTEEHVKSEIEAIFVSN
jgi:CarD family transcriptional regulator